jgi:WXG100 family type VII secretion target
MNAYKVTPEDLHNGQTNLTNFAEKIAAELEGTRNEVSRLGSGWEGTSAQTFADLMAKWKTLADQQQQNLRDIAVVLGKAGDAYADTERSVGQAFSG